MERVNSERKGSALCSKSQLPGPPLAGPSLAYGREDSGRWKSWLGKVLAQQTNNAGRIELNNNAGDFMGIEVETIMPIRMGISWDILGYSTYYGDRIHELIYLIKHGWDNHRTESRFPGAWGNHRTTWCSLPANHIIVDYRRRINLSSALIHKHGISYMLNVYIAIENMGHACSLIYPFKRVIVHSTPSHI